MSNLDAAKLKRGDKLVRNDGMPYVFVAYVDDVAVDRKLVAYCEHTGVIISRYRNGSYYPVDKFGYQPTDERDLFLADQSKQLRKTVFINAYYDKNEADGVMLGGMYDSMEDADLYAQPGRIGGKAIETELNIDIDVSHTNQVDVDIHSQVLSSFQPQPSIDWSAVDPIFRYLTRDYYGHFVLHEQTPYRTPTSEFFKGWRSDGRSISADGFSSVRHGACDWRDAVVKRGENE